MPHLWDVGVIILCHHFVLVKIYLLDTSLQCIQ